MSRAVFQANYACLSLLPQWLFQFPWCSYKIIGPTHTNNKVAFILADHPLHLINHYCCLSQWTTKWHLILLFMSYKSRHWHQIYISSRFFIRGPSIDSEQHAESWWYSFEMRPHSRETGANLQYCGPLVSLCHQIGSQHVVPRLSQKRSAVGELLRFILERLWNMWGLWRRWVPLLHCFSHCFNQ